MAGQEHGSTANPLDVPPAAAAPPDRYRRAGRPATRALPACPALRPNTRNRCWRPGYLPRQPFGSSSASTSVGTIPRRSSSPASRSNYCEKSTADLRRACARRACSTMRRWIRPSSGKSTHPTQLRLVADTMIRYTDRNVTQAPHKLGRGGFNSVYEVEYDDGKRRIFKPLTPPDRTRKKRIRVGLGGRSYRYRPLQSPDSRAQSLDLPAGGTTRISMSLFRLSWGSTLSPRRPNPYWGWSWRSRRG